VYKKLEDPDMMDPRWAVVPKSGAGHLELRREMRRALCVNVGVHIIGLTVFVLDSGLQTAICCMQYAPDLID